MAAGRSTMAAGRRGNMDFVGKGLSYTDEPKAVLGVRAQAKRRMRMACPSLNLAL